MQRPPELANIIHGLECGSSGSCDSSAKRGRGARRKTINDDITLSLSLSLLHTHTHTHGDGGAWKIT